jgi:hypothetical protein
MDVETIYSISDASEKNKRIKSFRHDIESAKRMIREASGIAKLDKLFYSMLKPRIKSSTVDYYLQIKKKYESNDKIPMSGSQGT